MDYTSYGVSHNMEIIENYTIDFLLFENNFLIIEQISDSKVKFEIIIPSSSLGQFSKICGVKINSPPIKNNFKKLLNRNFMNFRLNKYLINKYLINFI